tara:strand:+ start:9182 stop:9454 length:273 start_codon:yes stop_codon:yes gene_type:complete
MRTTHKLDAIIEIGGREYPECEITFTYLRGAKASWDDPGWSPELDFVSAKWTEGAAEGVDLDDMAIAFLQSDDGYNLALNAVARELAECR